MANFWDNDEVVPQIASKANFWDKDEVVSILDLATKPQTPTPVSENPDRQFSGSGVPIEDRFPDTPLSDTIADESTAPLSEVDPAADIASDLQVIKQPDKDVAAPETSLRPQMRPDRLGDKGFKIVTNTSMKPTFTLTNASLLTKPEAPERMDSLLRGAFQTLQQNFGSELIINDALPKKGSTREKNTPNSRHFHGDALDVSVAGMSDSAKLKLVAAAKKAGFKGFGFGNNILHIDMGRNRGWSYGNDLFAGKPVSDLIAQIKAP